MYRFHVLSLPHTETTKEYVSCAYTQKVINFCKMMTSYGHEVYLYAGEENEAPCRELITISSKEDKKRWFGDFDYNKNFYPITWGVGDKHWVESNDKAIKEIGKRIRPDDFICLIGGNCQQPIDEAFPKNSTVEFGVGYEGVFSQFRVFESYSHMHWVYGLQGIHHGQFYDCVIPNYYDPNDFKFQRNKDDYLLWVGRFIQHKGPQIAANIAERTGLPLIMAGQGVDKVEELDNGETKISGSGIFVQGKNISHVGHISGDVKKGLFAGARALIAPTTYIEPFGGVAVEAMFSGTPVIATDFGAFTETVQHGVSGYRFRTMGEAEQFTMKSGELDPETIRHYAASNYSLERVAQLYQDYFDQLYGLNGKGFYSKRPTSMNRYQKYL